MARYALWVMSRHFVLRCACLLYPQKRTFAVHWRMSGRRFIGAYRRVVLPWTLTHATFSAVEFLQKCLSELRSEVIGAQLGFSTGAIRKSDVNDTGGNSVAAANFVAVFIGAPDVDFSGTSHFGLRDRKLFYSRATKSSWTEVQCRTVMSASGQGGRSRRKTSCPLYHRKRALNAFFRSPRAQADVGSAAKRCQQLPFSLTGRAKALPFSFGQRSIA